MPLFWFEMGKRRGSPWQVHETPLPQSQRGSNPYQRQQEAINNADVKIVYAHQLMRKQVKSISSKATLNEALLMLKQHKIRHAPVINPEGDKLVGIISDRDILRKWAGIEDSFLDWIKQNENSKIPVSDCMTRKVLVADPDEKLVEIARAMFAEKVGCMPILNADENVVGIITRSDILRLIVRTAPLNFWL